MLRVKRTQVVSKVILQKTPALPGLCSLAIVMEVLRILVIPITRSSQALLDLLPQNLNMDDLNR